MHFKALELVGFKSFLNKTKLKFEPGVTAIVGPNGCGKSNIVDSMKWVCGEQSPKSMRGSTMQDVIFNGTDNQEAVNMAEVSITLSNEERSLPVDYDEVTITRRLFRSGESEYLINKTPVRLMDVRGILFGTGLGTSSYSVIEQGKMDMIVSSKPEDRRYVFEEASGITKYKAQKREAMLKLERTQENLTRINDIIAEIDRQIKTIERQARKAERYKASYEELKDLEIKLAKKKLKELLSGGTGMDGKAGEISVKSGEIKTELDELSRSLSELRGQFNRIMEDLHVSQTGIMKLSSDIDINTHTIQLNRERVGELEKFVQRLDWEIEESTVRKEGLAKRIEDLGSRHAGAAARLSQKSGECSSAEENLKGITESIEKLKSEIESMNSRIMSLAAERTEARNALIKLEADTSNMLIQEKRLQDEKAGLEKEKETVSRTLAEAEEVFKRVKEELDTLRKEHIDFSREYNSRQEDLSRILMEKNGREKRVNEIRPRIEFLEKLIAEREGIGEGVKEVMKRIEAGDQVFAGVRGILSELVNVKEGYEESLESVLSDFSQALVVETWGVAEKVTNFLAGGNYGSVSFIILDEVRGIISGAGGAAARRPCAPGFEDITSVLYADDVYRPVLEELLQDTFVAASSEKIREMVKDSSFSGRAIGLKGELFEKARYRSRNYSDNEVVTLFGRREKLKHLVEEEKRITEEISSLTVRAGEMERWLEEALARKRGLEEKVSQKQMECAEAGSKKTSAQEKYNGLEEEVSLLASEVEQAKASISDARAKTADLSARLEGLEKESIETAGRFDASQSALRDHTKAREEALFRVSDLRAELSALRKEEEHLADGLMREKESFGRIDTEVEERRKRISESVQRAKQLAEEAVSLEARNQEFGALREDKVNENSVKKAEKDDLARRIHWTETEVKEKESELEAMRNTMRDLDIKRKEVEYKREMIVQRMHEAYKIDILGVVDDGSEEGLDAALAESKIAELKDKVEKMGDVSLGAVEEHRELEERFAFLTKQRDDLEKGKEDVMKAITTINRTTRKMFMDAFEAIKAEFNVYFKMLFNGGRAELILENEDDVLECGIDIVVRPPGKKLQNIMLLSGGEKAMTAIALVFAIFKVNPSPFCVLDEIDAPLDESNIVRFCRVLKEFLKLSQFIIVTHNRMTIQLADILYGITMEEKGVSKVVSVKFREQKGEPATAESVTAETQNS